jgi:hypothetical protein
MRWYQSQSDLVQVAQLPSGFLKAAAVLTLAHRPDLWGKNGIPARQHLPSNFGKNVFGYLSLAAMLWHSVGRGLIIGLHVRLKMLDSKSETKLDGASAQGFQSLMTQEMVTELL